jgi:ribose 5-phosphate isomerase B
LLKEALISYMQGLGHSVTDFGTYSADRADYPDFGHAVATAIEAGEAELGVLVCGSGNGICITANRHKGVRAALAWLPEVAALGRQHNNANVLCLPARFVTETEAIAILDAFLGASFEGGRHADRVNKI